MLVILAQIAASALALTAASASPLADRVGRQAGPDRAIVQVDSARRTVVITVGPYHVVPATHGHGDMHAGHSGSTTQAFAWPVDGWVRGIALRVIGANGRELPRTLLHHLAIMNFGRRQLLKPTPERLAAFGQETSALSLPRTVGIPVTAGMAMAVALGWYNQASDGLEDIRLEITIDWMPASTMPRPTSVYPVSMGVVGTIGEQSNYDLPTGETRQAIAFTMPVDGRILAAGGHLHDYGTALRVDDLSGQRPKKVLELRSIRDKDGRVLEVERITPGLRGQGIRMHGGRSYQMTTTNANHTGAVLTDHAMAYVAMLYAPDRGASWPAADANHPAWLKELQDLFGRGY